MEDEVDAKAMLEKLEAQQRELIALQSQLTSSDKDTGDDKATDKKKDTTKSKVKTKKDFWAKKHAVFVRGLPFNATKYEIESIFSDAPDGGVKSIELVSYSCSCK
jgi:hypothetical protein